MPAVPAGRPARPSRADAQPWRTAFPAVADWDLPVATGVVPALLDRAAASYGDRPAIDFRDRRIRYHELAAAADNLAAGLLASGIGAGETVAIYLPNTPWHPVAFFAVARTGARIVLLSPLDASRELAHKLHDSGARTLITTDLPLLPTALRLLHEDAVAQVLVGEDAAWGGSALAAPPVWGERVRALPSAPPPSRWPELSAANVCLLQYTGGTTGLPKAAMLSHANLTAAVSMYANWHDGDPQTPGEQRVIAVLPLFHIYALTCVLLRNVAKGNELLLRPRFDVPTTLHDIATKRATVFQGVPTMWVALANHPDAAGCDFSSLRYCGSGGAPMPFDVRQRVERLIGQPLLGGWGMTELSPAGMRIPSGAEPAPGLIGIPVPGVHVKVVDRHDPARELPPGEAGELAIRGPNVFGGYWRRPEETVAAFHDGFFLTGDIGVTDARGVFRLLDRKKNMIISGGFNVYPAAVENAIYEHPSVAEVVVVGVPDAYRGQAAKAFVALRPGAPDLTLEQLREFLTDRLGRHELPAALEIRAELPRSPAGKLLANVLRDEAAANAHGQD